MTVLCGIRTCNELMVSEHDFSCNGYKHNILYFYHSLLPIIFFIAFFVLSLPPWASMKGAGCIINVKGNVCV